ncbi:helix-turn-helix transcriptional regulator [Actinoplanes sp. NBC_00393]|uniref:helix-turn-helix domain-containing protein n=1 Tax=Actinoplanes sp. NBC_00393 TaxID=2975953 RepID=UPI002E25121B
MSTTSGGRPLTSMQDRLNYLFETVRPVGKPRYSVREVAEAIKRDQSFEISAAYINYICTGERENPGVQQVRALARFFGVPAAFLLGDGDPGAVARELEQLRAVVQFKEKLQAADDAMNDPGVRVIALKARGLSPSHLKLVSTMLDQVREIEGLP